MQGQRDRRQGQGGSRRTEQEEDGRREEGDSQGVAEDDRVRAEAHAGGDQQDPDKVGVALDEFAGVVDQS